MDTNELWHGIPRKEIPWFPTVDTDACIGCTLCFLAYSQQEAISHLSEINAEISNLLGIDFASLAKKTNC